MALPHLSAQTTRKNIYEAVIVHRRNHTNDFHEKWSKNADYFRTNNVAAAKQKDWESAQSFNSSMNAWRHTHTKDTKKLDLERRRVLLAAMLAEERDTLQAELRGLSRDNYVRMEDMKDRSEALRSAREEKRKNIADEKLLQLWRQNNPDLRQLESMQQKQHVVSAWGDQIDIKEQIAEKERKEREEYERKLEADRVRAIEIEHEIEEERLEEEKHLKSVLKRQMIELRDRDREAAYLKMQEDLLMKQQWELEQMERENEVMEERRKKAENARVLMRQHAAVLRRKTREVQQQLEQDFQFLQRLMDQEVKDKEIQSARREKARADAAWMKEVVEEQLRVEKEREAEIDLLYQDEAAKVWQKREEEWAREKKARERLMKEVLADRQDQLVSKMDSIHRQQQESIERREELLRELEVANEMTRRDELKQEEDKIRRKQELVSQISARREKHDIERLQLEDEEKEEKEAEKNYEELLRHEAERLGLRGYEPKDHSRRQAWT